MSSRIFSAGALLAVMAGALVSGCMETRVKSSGPRYLTSQEAAEADYKRKLEAKEKGETPAPTPPRTVESEIVRLRNLIEKDDPNNPQWHFELGSLYESQGMNEPAEARYRTGAALMPGLKDMYTGPAAALGRVLAKQGKTDAALVALRQAVSVKQANVEGYFFNPDYRESYFLIGAIEYRKNRAEAERAFRQCLRYGGDRNKVVDFFPEMIEDK